jgi:hypothetical protein
MTGAQRKPDGCREHRVASCRDGQERELEVSGIYSGKASEIGEAKIEEVDFLA